MLGRDSKQHRAITLCGSSGSGSTTYPSRTAVLTLLATNDLE